MNHFYKKNRKLIGLEALSYELPASVVSAKDLEQSHLLNSSALLLEEFGFENCHISSGVIEMEQLMINCSEKTLTSFNEAVEPSRILSYSGIPGQTTTNDGSALELFRYDTALLINKLHLQNTNAMALSQQGCGGLLTMIDIAARLIMSSEEESSIMCLAHDMLPVNSKREIMYNLMSDSVGSLMVTENATKNYLVSYHQERQPFYWDTAKHEDELLAAYFPMTQRTIEITLQKAGLTLNDISWIVPHNVSRRSWEIVAKLLEFPIEKIWMDNIPRVGHTVASDHIINLSDMEKSKLVQKGDYLLLFTFGFGANWTSLIIQH